MAYGVDIDAFAARCWKLILRSPFRSNICPTRMPKITVRRSRTKRYTTARAYINQHRVTMTIGIGEDRADTEMTVLHELCHCAGTVERDGKRRQYHGHRFNRLFLDVAKRLWGDEFDVGPATRGGGYGPSRFVEDKLRQRYRAAATQDFRAAAAAKLRGEK